ncbi:SprT-like domain-containing protein [Acutalibacter intestini]|uniref:SprT-like domain-containing protein n=1 Tax=Acutalibacter intestini TaxID=3093659 RepID=UPI002AC8F7AB|nr:SprT-like domain-containing protein [Acutalibacter sp. M00204]
MNQATLDQLMAQLHQELKDLDIPVSNKIDPAPRINTRAKRRLGCCIYNEKGFLIEVSARVLEDPALLRQTLIHELLHTCPGCRNHGLRWKTYAQKAGEALGYSITRTVPIEEEAQPLRHEEVKYVLVCKSCGTRVERIRMSKAVRRPWLYRCRCGGRLERIR